MKKLLKSFLLSLISILIFSCQPAKEEKEEILTIGSMDIMDPKFNELIPVDAGIEVLAEGFEWSEGPVWIAGKNYLLFSDIPRNSIYKWDPEDSISLYLKPSGYTGDDPRKGESGSNGLLLNTESMLILCQHGDRRIAYMDAPLDRPEPDFVTLADSYRGKRLNSPNDAVFHANGELYFTDPPYGLIEGEDDPAKELEYQGVYRYTTEGELYLLTDELSRPNGIGFSPDRKNLYVANSDPDHAIWMVYDVRDDGMIENGRIFKDVTNRVGIDQGLPDGLAVHSSGAVFATGPGGVWIFDPSGTALGLIRTTQATANCTFNTDESYLYITADMYLLRVKLK